MLKLNKSVATSQQTGGGDYNRIFQVDQMAQTASVQPSLPQALESGFRSV